jgi:hypothetical protein
LERENLTDLSKKTTDAKGMDASSDTLNNVAKANKVLSFPTKMGKRRNLLLPSDAVKLMTRLGSQVKLYLGFGGLRL